MQADVTESGAAFLIALYGLCKRLIAFVQYCPLKFRRFAVTGTLRDPLLK